MVRARVCVGCGWTLDFFSHVCLLFYFFTLRQVLPGNHEVEQEGPLPATQTQFLAYQSRFKMPFSDCGAVNGSLYYSFQVGPATIFMLVRLFHGSCLGRDAPKSENPV